MLQVYSACLGSMAVLILPPMATGLCARTVTGLGSDLKSCTANEFLDNIKGEFGMNA